MFLLASHLQQLFPVCRHFDFRNLTFNLAWEDNQQFLHFPDLFDERINIVTRSKFRALEIYFPISGEIVGVFLQAADFCVVPICLKMLSAVRRMFICLALLILFGRVFSLQILQILLPEVDNLVRC